MVQFSDLRPLCDFFSKKATSEKSSVFLDNLLRVSVIIGIAAAARDQRTRSPFSAFALFSERLKGADRSVKTDIIATYSSMLAGAAHNV